MTVREFYEWAKERDLLDYGMIWEESDWTGSAVDVTDIGQSNLDFDDNGKTVFISNFMSY